MEKDVLGLVLTIMTEADILFDNLAHMKIGIFSVENVHLQNTVTVENGTRLKVEYVNKYSEGTSFIIIFCAYKEGWRRVLNNYS
jgi:hypothetical protein